MARRSYRSKITEDKSEATSETLIDESEICATDSSDTVENTDSTGAVESTVVEEKKVVPVQEEAKIELSVDPKLLRDEVLISLYNYFHVGEDIELFNLLQKKGSKVINDFNYVDWLCWKELFKILKDKFK